MHWSFVQIQDNMACDLTGLISKSGWMIVVPNFPLKI